ncbi:MAG TPA: hypothetical protein VJR24_16450 [Gemmatimonadaceae bacterium]|nr:hypothetical protein [Gemmatimonadaceae bacterium]
MRKQYFFRSSPDGLLAWDVDRLVTLSRSFPVRAVPLNDIRELDEVKVIDDNGHPITWRGFVEHAAMMKAADLAYPIILSADGAVMDGRHRVAKALFEGRATIDVVQFSEDPAPDFVGRDPDDLPY